MKRIDHFDPKIYTIDKVKLWKKPGTDSQNYIYHCEGQDYSQGWVWVDEWNIEKLIY